MQKSTKSSPINRGARFRKWSRLTHRYVSFFFAGVLVIYTLSGIFMNHLNSASPYHTLERISMQFEPEQVSGRLTKKQVIDLLEEYEVDERYTKHFYPSGNEMKIFFKGGSNLIIDRSQGEALYEKVRKRHVISEMTYLHYNPNKIWTWFADLFCAAMLLVIITGYTMMKEKEGFFGKGGIITLVGIIIPLLILYFTR